MTLAPGTRLGPYEILAPIGAGGMGEVYRARDTKLDRDVAIKTLPPALAVHPDRLARFEREAKVLAALNHPNIAAIYGLEDRAIVMELVEGPTLADRLRTGAMPLDETLKIAAQIADALEAAHEKGIVHRDLKPANVKVRDDGTVKVLDFGLATAVQASAREPGEGLNSPTLTIGATEAGTILGTAAYMSPEQAAGKPVDRRADIWSFGVVLWEMLTGKRLFQGETISHTLADVLRAEIHFGQVSAPAPILELLKRCLDRDIRMRLQAIGEARIVLANPVNETPATGTQTLQPPARLRWLPWTVTAVFALATMALGYMAYRHSTEPPPPITRFPLVLSEDQTPTAFGRLGLAMSADGSQVVYAANGRLYLYSLADPDAARAIPGTESRGAATNPVFSPDGKSLAFWDSYDSNFKRIATSGGTPITICAASNMVGMTWTEDGIVFGAEGKRIMRVSPNGGQPESLVTAKDNELIEDPQMLPGGQAVLFVAAQAKSFAAAVAAGAAGKTQIIAQTLKSGERKTVLQGPGAARYLPTGHLVYPSNGVLYAVPFDIRRIMPTGGPAAVLEGVARSSFSGEGQIAFSSTGSLIYVPGPVNSEGAGQTVLARVDRKGGVEPLKISPGSYVFPRVSRDGKLVAYQVDEGQESSVWIWELSGTSAPRRLTLSGSGSNRYPIWSADGQRVAFQSDREGDLGIWWQRADGNGAAERLTKPDKGMEDIPDSWSRDNQTISFTEMKPTSAEVWTYSLRDKKASVFAAAPGATLTNSVFSPDGRWISYQLSAQPKSRVYLRPFPRTETEFVAPVDADIHHPLWSPDGKELFYVAGPSIAGSMSVSTQPSVRFGSPVRMPRSGFSMAIPASVRTYDILPDGQQFLGVVPAGTAQAGSAPGRLQIRVVLNWFEEVRQRAPGR